MAEQLLARGDVEQAEPWLQRPATLAAAAPETEAWSQAPLDLALAAAALLRSNADQAEPHLAHAREAGEAMGRLPIIGEALLLQAAIHALRNEHAAASDTHHRAMQLLRGRLVSEATRAVQRLLLQPLTDAPPTTPGEQQAREGDASAATA